MARTSRELRQLKAKIRALLAENASEYDICEDLDLAPGYTRKLIAEVLGDEVSVISGDGPDQTFARYKLAADSNLDDLDDVIQKGKSGKDRLGLNAVVAAVKAKHTISNDVIKLGQNLGVIPDKPVAQDDASSKLTEDDLAARVEERNREMNAKSKKYGGGDFLDEEEDDLYLDDVEGEGEDLDDQPSTPPTKSGRITRKRLE